MAGVPEISVPTAQQETMPVAQAPVAPLASFAGAHVGAALDDTGEKLFGVGLRSYHLAVEANAQDKENEFQKKALQIRDKYKNLYNLDAVTAHDAVTQELEKARDDTINSIPSRMGQGLFRNNSLRSARLMQESIDSHFEQQNRSYQATVFKQGQDLDTQSVAALAADGNLAGASEKIEAMQKRAKDFAASHGLDPDMAEEMAAAKGAHALVKTMLGAKSALAKDAYAKWGDKLDPSYQGVAQKTIAEQAAVLEGEQILSGLPRVDADKRPNAKGAIDDDDYRKAISNLPADERGAAVRTYLESKKAKLDADHKAAGQQMEDRIYRLGQGLGPGGQFGIPQGSEEWEEFKVLYPTQANRLAKEGAKTVQSQTLFQQRQQTYLGVRAKGSALEQIGNMSDEQVKGLKYENVASMLRAHSPGVSGTEIQQVWKQVEERNSGKPQDPTQKVIPKLVQDGLKEAFGKNSGLVTSLAPDAHAYLDDLFQSDKTLKPEDLKKALVLKARSLAEDSSFFSRKSGLDGYRGKRTPPPAKPAEKVDFEWDPTTKKLKPMVH